jgi:hypothetical protein
MSITQISLEIKHSTLVRLLIKGEEFTDACSKSGLCKKEAIKFLIINTA